MINAVLWKMAAGDQFSPSWWSHVGSAVDIHALGLRDAGDKGAVMAQTWGARKAGGSPVTMQFSPQTSAGLSGPGTPLHCLCRTPRCTFILQELTAQWGQSDRHQHPDRWYRGVLA